MSASSRRSHRQWRRLTALAAACAFLLMSGLAALHHHSHGADATHVVLHPREPAAGPGGGGTTHSTEDCLACLWSRTAISGPPASRPYVSGPEPVRLHLRCDQALHGQLTPSGHLSRGPPASSA